MFRNLSLGLLSLSLLGPLSAASASAPGSAPAPGPAPATACEPGVSEWTHGAVVYGVVPPLFGEAPISSVTRRLDTLQAQGVDALWLSPILATDDPSSISYSVIDYTRVRPDFGTLEEVRTLVREAHARGMKVLMDFVPNHSSVEHPWFKERPHYYDRDERGQPTHYFNWETLKNLDFDVPEVRKEIIGAFAFWMREAGIDGFRVDAAWGIKERSPDFWPELVRALEEINPDVFLLAEASARDPSYVRSGFDAAYDWSDKLGEWAWHDVFADPGRAGLKLRRALATSPTPPHQVARFLNNNDTGKRFITRYGAGTTRVATVLLHTLPGLPVVFTGDEVGAEFEPYEDPPPISWRDRHGLMELHRRLATVREEVPALRCGELKLIPVRGKGSDGVFAFVRGEQGHPPALVVNHFGTAAKAKVALQVPEALRGVALRDLLTGDPVASRASSSGVLELRLPPSSALVLMPAAKLR